MKKALITGIAGQDGSYLTELLLSKGYEVHGIIRRVALEDPAHHLWRIQPVLEHIQLHTASIENFANIFHVVDQVKPTECYHLAAQSFVSYSFDHEFTTIHNNITSAQIILSTIKERAPECRFFFAASSEMFGRPRVVPQNEGTALNPRSPYGISKLVGFHLTRNYREESGVFACSGIMFNHESERRGFEYVTRKVTSSVARIKAGLMETLQLGNLDARRDWGYAPEYVHAMWLMLQQDKPDDYVLATGKTHSVRELVTQSFAIAGLNWEDHVAIDDRFYRPSEKIELRGDATKAHNELGWSPQVNFEELIQIMTIADMEKIDNLN